MHMACQRSHSIPPAGGHGPGSHVSRTGSQVPLAEPKRNEQPAGVQTSPGPHLPLSPEEAADPGRVAQKEKLHAELKRVLQKKGASQPSSEEAEEGSPQATAAGMEAQLQKMEKTIETSELLEIIVETEAEAGVSGMSVAGGGRQGLFIKDVLKGSPAARALSLREGDQLLSARVYFDNIKYEDALQILKRAEPYKVSFCLKRTVPGTDVTRSPGASTFEVRGPKAKMAKLSIQSLTSLKKKPKKTGKGLAKDLQETEGQEPIGSKPEGAPVDVEFSLPKFSKLRKARSTGEVAAAQPSPDLSPLLSSLETKRRKLKLPRLKVKEALAARAAGRLDVAPPKTAPEQKAPAQEGARGKVSRFTVPFSKGKKPKEEAAGFQAPQVELDFPMPKAGPRGESPEASADGEGPVVRVLPFGLPKVEMALPKGSPVGLEAPAESSSGGLKLPTAEVAAPKVDVGLSLPRLEGTAPEVALKGEGFQIRAPKVGVSAEGTEGKVAPLDAVLGKGRGKAEGLEEKGTRPSLDVGLPSVDVEILLPRGKAEAEAPKPKMEIPEVSIKVPTVSLPKLGSKPQENEERSQVPQVELSVGKRESPKAKSQIRGLGISVMESKSESKEPAESKMKPLSLKVPSLDLSAPKVTDMQLPKAMGGLEVPAPEGKAAEAVEGPRFKLQMPQVSLPKCLIPTKATPSPPQAPKRPEGDTGGKAGGPAVDLSLPAVKSLEVQLPKGHVPKPALDLCVDRPQVEVALPAARLSLPSAAPPALELDLPRVGIELNLPKVDSECKGPDPPPRDHGVQLKMPTLETLSRGLEVELSVPQCRDNHSEQQPGVEASEGPDVGVIIAKIPKVGLALGSEEAVEVGLVCKGGPELEGSARGGEVKLPSVGISDIKFPEVTIERGKSPETEAKPKSPKFALPKFSISGPKVWKVTTESFVTQAEGPDAADRGLKLKMPKFGISLPKSKWGADTEDPKPTLEGERRIPKEKELASAAKEGPSESRIQIPSVSLPVVEVPKLAMGTGLPAGKAESSDKEGTGISPDIKQKVPKFSLPKFGGKVKEGDVELETGEAKPSGSREALAGEQGAKTPEKETRAKASKFKMPLFSMARRDLEGVGPDAESKAKKGAGSPKEKPRAPLVKMPKVKLPSAKAELGQVQVPQVELPKISLPETKAEALLVGSESPSLKVKVPSLEIAVPGATTKVELTPGRTRVEASGADNKHHEEQRKILEAPSLDVSAPKVELHLSLPSAGAEAPIPSEVSGADVRIKLPQVELPTFERGEAADVQLQGAVGASKIQVPKVDLSLPKGQLPDMELPWTEGARAAAGPKGGLKMPSVELPMFSTPERELEGSPEGSKMLPTVQLSSPAIKLPKLRGSSLDGEGETEVDLPQLELKVPQLRGSAQRPGTEAEGKQGGATMPCLPTSFGLCKAGEEAGAVGEVAVLGPDSRFKLKIPSLSISKAGMEPSADTQPLCPSPREEEEVSFKMPQIALPEVGFSVDQDGKREAKVEAGKLARAEGLEAEGFEARLKMPKIKMPALGVSVPKGGQDTGPPQDPDGKKATFKVPSLELSAPTIKAHAEYEVEGAQLRYGGSQELEVAGRRVSAGSDDWKRPGSKGEASDAGRGKKYKVKIPKFGLSLPKAGEGVLGQEAEGKAKRPTFALGRPQGRGAEGSSGLLEGDEEADSKGVMGRFKLGLSLSKLKMGSEVNGEVEGSSSKMKLPKLGFSKEEGAQLSGQRAEATLQNGAQDGKAKLGKIRLPQVELSSPSTTAENDPELSLKLVRADEAASEGSGALAALKFKPPKIAFSGFKKRNGEAAPGAVVSSAARTEMASLERGDTALKGEKSPKFKFPKVALSPKSHGMLEITSKGQGRPEEAGKGSQQGLKVQLPRVGFSDETGGGPPGVAAKADGEGTAAV